MSNKVRLAGFDADAVKASFGVKEEKAPAMPSLVGSMREESRNQAAYIRATRPRKSKKKRTVQYIKVIDPTVRPMHAGSLPTGRVGFDHGRPKRIKNLMQAQKEAQLNEAFDKQFEVRQGRVFKKPEKAGLGKLFRKAGHFIAKQKSIYR